MNLEQRLRDRLEQLKGDLDNSPILCHQKHIEGKISMIKEVQSWLLMDNLSKEIKKAKKKTPLELAQAQFIINKL
jgi:hypothetical protein